MTVAVELAAVTGLVAAGQLVWTSTSVSSDGLRQLADFSSLVAPEELVWSSTPVSSNGLRMADEEPPLRPPELKPGTELVSAMTSAVELAAFTGLVAAERLVWTWTFVLVLVADVWRLETAREPTTAIGLVSALAGAVELVAFAALVAADQPVAPVEMASAAELNFSVELAAVAERLAWMELPVIAGYRWTKRSGDMFVCLSAACLEGKHSDISANCNIHRPRNGSLSAIATKGSWVARTLPGMSCDQVGPVNGCCISFSFTSAIVTFSETFKLSSISIVS
mmetsp:Transcript_103233/g.230590  ORF Transcript_103233/g.230590 Transcript_103233/m.230590 type:complete len:281 (-) Transcript_103233:864-1706(-)